MPMIQHRKVEITFEYVTSDVGTNGELVDRISAPLETASNDLVKDHESGIDSFKVTRTVVWPRRFGTAV